MVCVSNPCAVHYTANIVSYLVSQFTLYGKMKKGNKPDFHDAAKPEIARKVYDHFYNKMSSSYKPERVKNGVFQAMMEVELKNDGPVGVDYRSEDAAVYIAFLAFVHFASRGFYVLMISFYRSLLRSIPIYRRRSLKSPRLTRTTKAGRGTSRSIVHLNSQYPQSCCNKKDEEDMRVIWIMVMYILSF